MNTNREQKWQAYIDGELSACETTDFEATLSEVDKRMLAADTSFNRKLNQFINQGTCPDDVWSRVRGLALRAATNQRVHTPARNWRLVAGAALAAGFLVIVLGNFTIGRRIGDSIFLQAAASVEQLRAESEIAPGRDAVFGYLALRGIHLGFPDDETIARSIAPHTSFEFVGARQVNFRGDKVTEVLASCCEKPVRIVIAPVGSKAAKELVLASAEPGPIQATRNLEGYVAGVVSEHPTTGLVNILQAVR